MSATFAGRRTWLVPWICLSLLAGVAASETVHSPEPDPSWAGTEDSPGRLPRSLALATAFVAGLAGLLLARGRAARLLLAVALFVLGFLRADLHQQRWEAERRRLSRDEASWTWISGVVETRARHAAWGRDARARLDLPGRPGVRLQWSDAWSPRPGDAWTGACRLRPILPHGRPQGIDRLAGARAMGVTGVATPLCLYAGPSGGTGPFRTLQRMAVGCGDAVEARFRRHLQGPHADFLCAFLLGRREGLDRGRVESFRDSGVSHLLAISGLHVGFLVLAVGPIFGWAGRRRGLRLLGWCGFLAFFAVLTGGAAPVWRASLMIVCHQAGRLRGFSGGALVGWCLGAALEAWLRPASILGPGFTLSYGATLGLLLAARRSLLGPWSLGRGIGRPWIRRLAATGEALLQTAAASIVVLVATGPLLMAYFGRWLPLSVFHNVLLVPTAGLLLGGALGALALSCLPGFPGLAAWSCLDQATALFLGLQEKAATWIPKVPVSGRLDVSVAVVLTAAICLLLMGPAARRWGARSLLAAGALAAGLALTAGRDGTWSAHFLSLGRGEAIVLHWSDGRHWLVDVGPGGVDGFEAPILRSLAYLGITRVDRAVVTHDHWDHAGALPDMEGVVAVDTVAVGPGRREAVRALPSAVIEEVEIGHRWRPSPDHEVVVLHPTRTSPFRDNDASVVMKVEGRGMSLLLTGDLEGPGERDMVSRSETLCARILKVGHHGRATSTGSELLDAVDPAAAVVLGSRPGGEGTDPVVKGRLDAMGVRVLEATRCGALLLHSRRGRWRLAPLSARGELDLGPVSRGHAVDPSRFGCSPPVRVL